MSRPPITYVSTRGKAPPVSAAEAVIRGLSPDGGLYAPAAFPRIERDQIASMIGLDYAERAARVLSLYLTDFTFDSILAMCRAAYARFERGRVAPVINLDPNTHVMELFHGPTLAFKDVALVLLPRLMSASAEAAGIKEEILVLAATSGDTGKAALSGFMNVPGTRCAVFYPEGGVSEAQRLQMVTQAGSNTHVIAVEGNFDDAQTGVKRIFNDLNAKRLFEKSNRALTSANSINFGRLAPQIAYYFSAYADLCAAGSLDMGNELNFCVPTGNFGNILAAYYAKAMGLPVGTLICASNKNHVLTDFIETGVYDAKRNFCNATIAPSMDILVSSNFERMLYEMCSRNSFAVAGWMEELSRNGSYAVDPCTHARLRGHMWGGWEDEAETMHEIRRCWHENGYLLDPHTATAAAVLGKYRVATGDTRPCVIAATASPFKFARAVTAALLDNTPAVIAAALDRTPAGELRLCRILEEHTGLPVPAEIAELADLPVRHTARCAPDEMLDTLISAIEGAS